MQRPVGGVQPVQGIDAVEGPAAGVQRVLVRLLGERGVLVQAEVDDGTACKANELPAVEMGGIEHRVLGKKQQRLELRDIAGHQSAVGVRQGAGHELDCVSVVRVLLGPALRGRRDGEDHPEQPVFRTPEGPRVFLVHVADKGIQGRPGKDRVEG